MAQKKTLVQKWIGRIDKEIKTHKEYRKQGQESDLAARDDTKTRKYSFNIFWANNKILRSAVYANRPKSDVRRRFTQPDPEEKELARLVERALEYNLDTGG